MRIFTRLTILLFLFVAYDEMIFASLPESVEARRKMMDYMTAPLRPFQEVHREVIPQRSGGRFFFRTYEQTGSRYYAFMHTDEEGDLALAAPGTWIVRRRLEDGAFEQIKVFLQNDESSFLRIFPAGRTTRMDVEIAGVPLYRGIPVPMTLERVLTAPYAMLQASTRGIVEWNLLEPDTDHPGYRRIERVVERIRSEIPRLNDADDGAMNSDGTYVFIETGEAQGDEGGLNCSGFAKWVVDGFYRPRTGELLPVEPLKTKHLDYRGTSWSHSLEETRDPYFGLDWTRNLALHLYVLDHETDPAGLDPGIRDVDDLSSADYIRNVGYSMQDIRHVLYRLALSEPGTMYLGSVNQSFGDDLVLRQHTHVVVFLPWFDSSGRFRVAVMERNAETSITSLVDRYEGEYIHLVRVATSDSFDPP